MLVLGQKAHQCRCLRGLVAGDFVFLTLFVALQTRAVCERDRTGVPIPKQYSNERRVKAIDTTISYDTIINLICRYIMLEPIQNTLQQAYVQAIDQQDKIAVIIKGVVRTADSWNLSNAEAAMLFDVPTAT